MCFEACEFGLSKQLTELLCLTKGTREEGSWLTSPRLPTPFSLWPLSPLYAVPSVRKATLPPSHLASSPSSSSA